MVTKPRDYRHLDGFGFFCDACGKDTMRYETGGYHCATCKDWDCCLACGATPSKARAAKAKAKKKAAAGGR